MEIPIWEYNNKFYLEINAVKVKEAKVEHGFKKIPHTLWIKSFQNMLLRRAASRLQVIPFLKLTKIKNTNLYIHIQNGIDRISFKTFFFFISL